MLKKFLVIASLVLTSCSPQPKQGDDGYIFGRKQYSNDQVLVSVVTYTDHNKLVAEGKKHGADYPNLVAFSLLNSKDKRVCTVHMMDPSVSYQPEFVGHEFLHCVYGQWHTNNDKNS